MGLLPAPWPEMGCSLWFSKEISNHEFEVGNDLARDPLEVVNVVARQVHLCVGVEGPPPLFGLITEVVHAIEVFIGEPLDKIADVLRHHVDNKYCGGSVDDGNLETV